MRAAFFDIDGTLTSERTWKGLISYFQERGLRRRTHLVFLSLHYPLYFLRRLHLISEGAFRGPWAAHLAWYVRGYTVAQAAEVWDWAVDGFLAQYWRADSLRLLENHRRAGDLVMLVSSGPQPMVERIARQLGAQHAVGTRFEVKNGLYSGRSLPPVVIDEVKATAALAYLQAHNLPVNLAESYAYADSTADLGLLQSVGHPTAVYPDDGLRQTALQRGWPIFPDERRTGEAPPPFREGVGG